MNEQKFGPLPVLGLTMGGGILGFVLRKVMLKTGFDGKGIQISGHWTFTALLILSVLLLGCLAYLCRHMGTRSKYEENFAPSRFAGGCGLLAGVLLFISQLLGLLSTGDVFEMVVGALGIAGALSLCVLGALRCRGGSWLSLHGVVTAALAAILISRFRHWSSDPLLGDYCFQLLANVFAMLASYHLGCFRLDKGKRRVCIFHTMAAVFFSMISLADTGWETLLFNGAMILWLFPGVCDLNKPARPRRRLGGGFDETEAQE